MKKAMAILLTAVMILACSVPSLAFMAGDIDDSNSFNVQDLIRLKKHLSGSVLLTGDSLKAADVDGNGSVEAADLVLLRQYILGVALSSLTHTVAFDAITARESEFLYQQRSTASMTDDEGSFRFLNSADSFFTYAVDVKSAMSTGKVTVKIGQMFQKVEISFDGENWNEVFNISDNEGVWVHDFNLVNLSGFSGNTGKVYVRLSGGDGYTGAFGTCLYNFALSYQLANNSLYSAPTGVSISSNTFSFLPNTADENVFLMEDVNSGIGSGSEGVHRFINGIGSYFTYGINLGGKLLDGVLTLRIGQWHRKIEISFDGVSWYEALNDDTEGLGVYYWDYDLETVPGFSGNTGTLFLRLSGSAGYDGGFGTCFYGAAIDYSLESDTVPAPAGIIQKLTIDPCSDEEKLYMIENIGSKNWGDNSFRYLDGPGSTFTYGMNMGAALSSGALALNISGIYRKIEVSFSGSVWYTILDTNVDLGLHPFNYDLTAVPGFSGNDGKLFVRFSGGTGYTGGFGTCLYDFNLSYRTLGDVKTNPVGLNRSLNFNTCTDTEALYLLENVNTNIWGDGEFRFIDGLGSTFSYGVDTGAPMTSGTLNLMIGQWHRKIEISFDGVSWYEALNDDTPGLGVYDWNCDLASVPGFSGNTGKLYVRLSGSTGYDGGFGICLYNFDLSCRLAGDVNTTISPIN